MPFGFVTQRQLDQHREELAREIEAAREDQARLWKKIEVEWNEWFDKFRRLYARLAKRARDADDEGGVEVGRGADESPPERAPADPAQPSPVVQLRRRLRGF
jgi:hypothetical protein